MGRQGGEGLQGHHGVWPRDLLHGLGDKLGGGSLLHVDRWVRQTRLTATFMYPFIKIRISFTNHQNNIWQSNKSFDVPELFLILQDKREIISCIKMSGNIQWGSEFRVMDDVMILQFYSLFIYLSILHVCTYVTCGPEKILSNFRDQENKCFKYFYVLFVFFRVFVLVQNSNINLKYHTPVNYIKSKP